MTKKTSFNIIFKHPKIFKGLLTICAGAGFLVQRESLQIRYVYEAHEPLFLGLATTGAWSLKSVATAALAALRAQPQRPRPLSRY